MKNNTKWKFQAQRKFAQGAHFPLLSATAVAARAEAARVEAARVETARAEAARSEAPPAGPSHATPVAPPNRDDRNVIQNHLSASHLLDIVSFQSIHTHSDPVVLLERLAPKIEIAIQNCLTDVDRGPTASPAMETSSTYSSTHSSTYVLPVNARVKLSSKTSTMCLRSRSSLHKSMRRSVLAKKKQKAMKLRKGKRPIMKLRRKRSLEKTNSSTTSDVDDERPLQYFKRNKEPPVSPVSDNEAERRVLCPLANDKETKHHKVQGTVIRKRRQTQFLQRESDESSSAGAENSNTSPAVGDNVQTFKEPAIPTRSRRSLAQPAIYTETTDAGTAADAPSTADAESRLYSSTAIESWLTSQLPVESVEENRVGSPCPAESLRSVRDVMRATPNAMKGRCNKCTSCTRVDVLQKIVKYIQKARSKQNQSQSSDVYEFSDREESVDPPSVYKRRRRRNSRQDSPHQDARHQDSRYQDARHKDAHHQDARHQDARLQDARHQDARLQDARHQDARHPETRNPDTRRQKARKYSDEEKERLDYIDLVEGCTTVLQVTTNQELRNTNSWMTCKLIHRAEKQIDNVAVVEQENLLQDLIQSLVVDINNCTNLDVDFGFDGAGLSKKSAPNAKDRDSPSTSAGPLTRARAEEESNNAPTQRNGPLAGKLLEAPVYYPTEAEFNDPIAYFEKIAPSASKYGICKVVAPANFKPRCDLNENIKFNVSNHYIARLYSRWGPSARDMSAIKAYLSSHNVTFQRVPLLDGLEVNLSKLYAAVQRNGGLNEVIEKKRWGRVADEMNFLKGPNLEKIVDSYYVKYLLPYDTATKQERQEIVAAVDRIWEKKHRKLVAWARNPLHHQKKLLGESDSSEEEGPEEEERSAILAMSEAEDCIVAGRPMVLNGFKRVAQHANLMYMGRETATPDEVEEAYWQLVLFGKEHVCVNAASIDTSAGGYGFSRSKSDPSHKHPWNLKMFSSNSGNVLRSLGAVLGVTVPTLHLGMVFATSCWHRDPHGLPWVEYMHEGAPKIWYGIPDEQSMNFRNAVDALCPTSCLKKPIWLSSDITMIPPNLLREHHVSLSRAVQSPGEYIIVFPKAYSCSISTGYTVTESVYFATKSWLNNVHQDFQELRSSCEPTTFSIEHLLLKLATDARLSTAVLQQVWSELTIIVNDEIADRRALINMGMKKRYKQHVRRSGSSAWNVREQAECAICRATLYLSKVSGVITKKKEVCIAHALRLLQKRGKLTPEALEPTELVIFKSEEYLEDVLKNLQSRILQK